MGEEVQIDLHKGDCLELMKNIPDNSIDLIATDPPYSTTARGNAGNSDGMLQKEINKKGKVFAHNDIQSSLYAPEFYRVLKDGSHCYVMTNHIHLIEFLNNFTDLRTTEEKQKDIKPYGFHFVKCLIWDKGNKIMGQYYMSQFEYILFFRKGKGVRINNCGTSDILSVKNIKTKGDGGNLHDTEKPINLMQILIENSSKENQIVLDPFMGIGSTGIACVNTNRNFIGIELDDNYFKIAENRINDAKTKWLDSLLGGEEP